CAELGEFQSTITDTARLTAGCAVSGRLLLRRAAGFCGGGKSKTNARVCCVKASFA
ncbi:hypothetical protein BaRGS_00007682, partial [Batillaria attramentaria]